MDRAPLWIKLLAVLTPAAMVLSGLTANRPTRDSTVETLDPFADVAGVVAALHRQHHRADCQLRVGIWEPQRPDAARFDPVLLGAVIADGQRWLDVRQLTPLTAIVDDRLALCVAKGFDGVAFGEMDGYRHATGFPLTEADQARFNAAVIDLARRRGLSVAGVGAGSAGTSTTSGS